MTERVHVWLAQDPDNGRIFAQTHEWDENSFPRRHWRSDQPHRTWQRREADVETDTFVALLRGEIDPAEQDALHLTWWEQGAVR